MIELSGYVPDRDIKIEFTGLRPGEKLFEELSNTAENHVSTVHPKIARFITKPMPFYEVKSFMDRLSPQIDNGCSPSDLKQAIREMVPEYNLVPLVAHPLRACSLAPSDGERVRVRGHSSNSLAAHKTTPPRVR